MKYYSKSPEEWKKEDEKKLGLDKTNALRKRAWLFLFVNIILVFGVFMLVGIYLGGKGVLLPFFQKRSAISGPINVFIKFPKSDGKFLLGEPIDAKVYAQNTEKFPKKVVIEDFSFEVQNGVGDPVYSFVYSSRVEKELSKFESVLVFDLKREKILDELPKGEYRIRVSMRLNGRDVTIVKTFHVEEEFGVVVDGFQAFYFRGEIPFFKIGIENLNFKAIDLRIKEVSMRIESSDGKRLEERKFKVVQSVNVPQKRAVEIVSISTRMKLDRIGMYKLFASVLTDRGEFDFSRAFMVIDRDQVSIENVGVIIESPINVEVNELINVSVFLYNSSMEDRFTLIKEGEMFVSGNGQIGMGNVENLRIWFTKNEKVKIFEKELSFDKPGDYKITVLFKTDLGNLYKELDVRVGGGGG